MQTINTVADFKRLIQVGAKVACIFHMERAGRDEAGNVFYKDLERGEREVTIKQTNSFALKTWQETKQQFVDSWCSYPKASETVIKDNKVTIFEETREGKKIPILTYWIN
jgi:hypothetical protein